MKKMTKGAIVTGLGVALLLGGGGTLATWNDVKPATQGSIVTGSMNLIPGESVWTSNLSTSAIATDIAIDNYRIIPEEELTYTQGITVKTEGNLQSVLSLNTGYLDSELLDNLSLTKFTVSRVDENGTTTVVDEFNDDFGAQADVEAGTYKVSATVRFDASGTDAMSTSLDLSSIQYVLTQKEPTPVNSSAPSV